MIASNDYYLNYYPKRNQIVISLPQTSRTLTNTFAPVADRRTDVKESDLIVLLNVTKLIFNKIKMDEVLNVPLRNGKSMMELERLMDEVTDV